MIYKLSLSIGFPTAIRQDEMEVIEIGFSNDDWEQLDPAEREAILQTYLEEWASNYISMNIEESK
jgi:hypothetical protein